MRPSEVPADHAKRMEEYRNVVRRNAMVDLNFPAMHGVPNEWKTPPKGEVGPPPLG